MISKLPRKLSRCLQFWRVAGLGCLMVVATHTGSVAAVECAQAALTANIAKAMGRAPRAGECNLHLYSPATGAVPNATEIRATLDQIQASCSHVREFPTQSLPLRACGRRDPVVASTVLRSRY